MSVSSAHLRYMNPTPRNLGTVLSSFKRVLVPEMNLGQLVDQLRGRFLIDAICYSKIQGKPFMISEIEAKIAEVLQNEKGS
jgi:2-oxoglutarate ferredoxin oxidoreductase subunit alpha